MTERKYDKSSGVEPAVLDAHDLARALKSSVPFVRSLIKRGDIPSFNLGERKTFVRREALDAYLSKLEAAGAAV
jgi:excisionase family DNA binding protein